MLCSKFPGEDSLVDHCPYCPLVLTTLTVRLRLESLCGLSRLDADLAPLTCCFVFSSGLGYDQQQTRDV